MDKADDANPINATIAGPEFLEKFWNLASLEQAQRQDAALSLASDLETAQQAFLEERISNGQSAESSKIERLSKPYKLAEVEKLLTEHCAPLLVYGLQRLVKGLASGRQAARQGFALALALVLTKLTAIPLEAVVGLISLHLQATKTMSGGDARDAMLGRLFGLSAVVRSRDLTKHARVAAEIASGLLVMLKQKVYLREAAVVGFLELTASLGAKSLQKLILGCEELKEVLTGPLDTATPEDLLIALHLWGSLPTEWSKQCRLLPTCTTPPPRQFFASDKPVAEEHPIEAAQAFFLGDHFQKIVGILKNTTMSHPRVHSVVLAILGLLIPGFTASKVNVEEAAEKGRPVTSNIESFWRIFVEDELLVSSHERKFLGFQLFNILLPFLGADQVPIVFSANFSHILTSSLNKKENALHPIAKKSMARIKNVSEQSKDADVKTAFAVVLQRQPGRALGQITKGPSSVIKSMDESSTSKYLAHLKDVFEGKVSDDLSSGLAQPDSTAPAEGNDGVDAALEKRRQWSLDQLSGICSLPNISAELQATVTSYLITHSFFQTDKNLSEATRRLCASRLMTVLEAAGKAKRSEHPPRPVDNKNATASEPSGSTSEPKPVQKSKAPQHDRRSENELLKATVSELHAEMKSKELLVELSEPIEASLNSLKSTETRLSKSYTASSSEDSDEAKARSTKELSLLQLSRWLQLYIVGDAQNVDAGLGDEIAAVAQAALGKTGKKRKSAGADPTPWQDRLIDVLLSLSAYSSAQLPSVPLREAVEATFRAFATDITQTGLEDMVRVIAKPYNSSKDAEEEVVEESDDEASESETEEANGSDSEKSEESGDKEMEDRELQPRDGKKTDTGPESSSDSEEEDEGMTDEQMFRMDKMLVAVLQTQKDAKNSPKDTKQALQNFKLRVLAMLESYAKAVPNSISVAGILGQLVKAAGDEGKPSGSKAVFERLTGVIIKLCRSKPASGDCQGIAAETISKGIIAAHLALAKSSEKELSKAPNQGLTKCSEAAIHYLIGLASSADSEKHRLAAQEACLKIQEDLFERRRLQTSPRLLMEIARRHPCIAECQIPGLAELLGSARTPFLQNQAAEILAVCLRTSQSLQSADLATIAKNTGSIVEGGSFPSAKKHAECLKNLATIWQTIQKRHAEALKGLTGKTRDALKSQCAAASGIAANAKISSALSQIGSVLGLELGNFDPNAPKQQYHKAATKNEGIKHRGKASADKEKLDGLTGVKKQASGGTQKPSASSQKTKGRTALPDKSMKSAVTKSNPGSKVLNGSHKKAKLAVDAVALQNQQATPSGILIEDPLATTGAAEKISKPKSGLKSKKKAKKTSQTPA